MEPEQAKAALERLIEKLAAIEHDRWSHWQRYLHSCGTKAPDGSLRIPAELVARWERQIATPYADLSEKEKDSDREHVRDYLVVVLTWMIPPEGERP